MIENTARFVCSHTVTTNVHILFSGAWLQSTRLVDNVSANKNHTCDEKYTQNQNQLNEKAPATFDR